MTRSTMAAYPLTVTQILRHGARVHPDRVVATWDGTRATRRTFTHTTDQIERLASALSSLGVRHGDVVGTFCWNHQAHVEAYFAVPCMGAVLHTLNIRLFPDQLAHVIWDGGDRVIIVDDDLLPQLAQVPDALARVEHVIVVGAGDATVLGREVLRYDELLDQAEPGYTWPTLGRAVACRDVPHLRHEGAFEGAGLLPPLPVDPHLRHDRGRPPRRAG